MYTFSEKIVWITGASSGIGEALSYAFAGEGAQLVLSARRMEELERVRSNCSHPESVELLPLDISHVDELPGKAAWVIRKFGRIDILVNNAGISQRSVAANTSMEVYRRIMEVNFFGTIALSAAVLPHFLEKNEGRYVIISSVAGKIGLPLRTAYCASKHAIEGFFSALRTETWRTNMHILMVRPGAVQTKIAQNALQGDGSLFQQKDKVIENGITPEAVARDVLQAIRKDKKELVTGSRRQRMVFIMNRFMPGIVFNTVKKYTP